MNKYHVELDIQLIETAIFEIEADSLEEATEMALTFTVEPIDCVTHETDESRYQVDHENTYQIDPPTKD